MGTTRAPQLNVTLDPEQRRWLRQRARAERVSQSAALRQIVQEAMNRDRGDGGKEARAKAS